MFESLDEHIKHDEEAETTRTERILRWVAVVVISVVVFGGLYFGVRLLE
ncbi:MAG TPA: hypothetical protein VNJ11_05055 [Bryobacteraceae bacterium]|nr:hypothetical protein [Bryobacteraceae bacterium]HXG32711.1 hypothetical protein [Bryobacteraceae bacterium]